MTKDRLAALKAAQVDEEDVAVGVEEKGGYMEEFFQEVCDSVVRNDLIDFFFLIKKK